MVDCLLLWRELERPGLALLYLAMTLLCGIAALLGGWLLGQGLRG
jgi:fluoride ion exporter CrcB/FEX